MAGPKKTSTEAAELRSALASAGPAQVRKLIREVERRHRPDEDLTSIFATVRGLWKGSAAERSFALRLLVAHARRLDAEDWVALKGMMPDVDCEEHADLLAVELLGTLVKRDRSWCRVLRHWGLSTNVWERRAAVQGVYLRTRQMGDVEAAFEACAPLLEDSAPEVQSAVVRVLEEAWKSNPEETRAFLSRPGWKSLPPPLRRLLGT